MKPQTIDKANHNLIFMICGQDHSLPQVSMKLTQDDVLVTSSDAHEILLYSTKPHLS
jgi:hypothetical protein